MGWDCLELYPTVLLVCRKTLYWLGSRIAFRRGISRTNCNARIVPFHREDPPTLRVEIRPIRRPTPFNNSTTSIVIDQSITFSIILAVRLLE